MNLTRHESSKKVYSYFKLQKQDEVKVTLMKVNLFMADES